MARTSASSRPLTDHEEIRNWAEERGAKPTCVRGTGSSDDVGMIRLDFPGYTGDDKLEEISWDEWFDKFDENGLALLVQDQTARGQRSNFNKLVSRETAGVSEGNGSSRSRGQNRRSGSSRDEEGYEASGYSEDEVEGSDQDLEEELEEDIDIEDARPVRASGAGNSRNRKRQARTTGREGSRSARSSATARRTGSQAGRSRNERSTSARTSTSKRGQGTGGSRSSSSRSSSSRSSTARSGSSRSTGKKAPARARTSGSRTSSRGRSSSSRKRAA